MDYVNIQKEIIEQWRYKYLVIPVDDDHSYVNRWMPTIIFFCKEHFDCPNVNGIFQLLHELGHCEANDDNMSEYEEEFYATQWAIKEIKKYNIMVDKYEIAEWNDYINSFISKYDKKMNLIWR